MSAEKDSPPKAPRPSPATKRAPASHPKTFDMVLEAVASVKSQSKGVALPTIKKYIEETYPTAKTGMLNTLIKRSIERGLEDGLLIKPPSSEGTGMRARWKVDKQKVADLYKPKKKVTKAKTESGDKPKSAKVKKTAKSPSRKTKSPKSAEKKPTKKSLGDKKKSAKSPKTAKKSPKTKPSKPKPKSTKSPKTTKSPKAKPKKAPSSSAKQKTKKDK